MLKNAREYVDRLAAEGKVEASALPSTMTDLDRLALPAELKEKLLAAGFGTIQRLAVAEPGEILAIEGVGEPEYAVVREATEGFLRHLPPRV